MFAVMKERCGQCLYGKDKIVGNARRSEILRKLQQQDGHFICHKASIAGVEAACHGDWEQRGCGQMGRIAERLNAIKFVAEADLASLPKAKRYREDDAP